MTGEVKETEQGLAYTNAYYTHYPPYTGSINYQPQFSPTLSPTTWIVSLSATLCCSHRHTKQELRRQKYMIRMFPATSKTVVGPMLEAFERFWPKKSDTGTAEDSEDVEMSD